MLKDHTQTNWVIFHEISVERFHYISWIILFAVVILKSLSSLINEINAISLPHHDPFPSLFSPFFFLAKRSTVPNLFFFPFATQNSVCRIFETNIQMKYVYFWLIMCVRVFARACAFSLTIIWSFSLPCLTLSYCHRSFSVQRTMVTHKPNVWMYLSKK